MMIVFEFLHKNRIGLIIGRCSKMYSSVARLNMILLDSPLRMSTCPGVDEIQDGRDSVNMGFDLLEKHLLLTNPLTLKLLYDLKTEVNIL